MTLLKEFTSQTYVNNGFKTFIEKTREKLKIKTLELTFFLTYTSDDFCRLKITFANRLNPDQDRTSDLISIQTV